jgi:hypothetical protein
MTVKLRKLTGRDASWIAFHESRGHLTRAEEYAPISGRGIVAVIAWRLDGAPHRLFERLERVGGVVEWYEVDDVFNTA